LRFADQAAPPQKTAYGEYLSQRSQMHKRIAIGFIGIDKHSQLFLACGTSMFEGCIHHGHAI